ncbi:unnamed protein product [marine sediment metagenome]|uniref:Uncharacterized protein n=1 Tax=marine sediment metagenome TaxID=412755 RepID=X1VKS5_9ZZZZ
MTWGCQECAIRLKNILKARLKLLPALEVWKAPTHPAEKLHRVKRLNKAFHYARAINKDAQYVLVRSDDYMNAELLANGFEFTELSANDVIDGLPHAPVGRRQRRFIPSQNFWVVRVNNTTPAEESKINNSDEDAPENDKGEDKMGEKQMAKLDKEVNRLLKRGLPLGRIAEELGEDMETVKASFGRLAERSDFDIVVLDDKYSDVLGRLRARGFEMLDTGEGESHRLFVREGEEGPVVAPEELGEVVEVISY